MPQENLQQWGKREIADLMENYPKGERAEYCFIALRRHNETSCINKARELGIKKDKRVFLPVSLSAHQKFRFSMVHGAVE